VYQAIVQSLRYFLAPIYELHEIRQVPTARRPRCCLLAVICLVDMVDGESCDNPHARTAASPSATG